ncbi:hypothetical protein H920_16449 [Fukomys damarensis]|uniref:Uncharacterized protein n=1 Tax=Fukomys damarensis TaxID=885580 RepID=A0A091CWI0_FUKDA|nr:hypothetical protein H920_16449 [Fukomys damarensis]
MPAPRCPLRTEVSHGAVPGRTAQSLGWGPREPWDPLLGQKSDGSGERRPTSAPLPQAQGQDSFSAAAGELKTTDVRKPRMNGGGSPWSSSISRLPWTVGKLGASRDEG